MFGEATFATNENVRYNDGISIGNYININNSGKITGNFDDYVLSNPMYMHEYGHTIDSRKFGLSYLFAIGLPSLISAANSTQIHGEPIGVETHDFKWYEMRANRNASKYFKKYYSIDWNAYETYYPRTKR